MSIFRAHSSMEEKFLNDCLPVIKELGYELYDLNYISGSSTLRIFIMNKETKTAVIEDCIKVDRELTPVFEQEWIPEDIVLEVSSPGMYRPIKSPRHLELALGERISCTLKGEYKGDIAKLPKKIQKSNKFVGVLKTYTDEVIELDINGNNIKLDFSNIKKASLDPVIG